MMDRSTKRRVIVSAAKILIAVLALGSGFFCRPPSAAAGLFPGRIPTNSEAAASTFGCEAGPTVLCLHGGRFEVKVDWRDSTGNAGPGQVVPFHADDSGNFWFYDESNWELLVKVIDGCAVNGRFWVFAGGATDVGYTLSVTDTVAGGAKSYVKPVGSLETAVTDTSFFSTCTALAPAGAVYAMTDAVAGNEVVVYDRASDGTLSLAGSYPTGGRGVGDTTEPADALGAADPLLLSPDQRWLFAVNAGSDDISVFRVFPRGLVLADRVASGGSFPASLALHGDHLYVLNSGGEGNITGFTVAASGKLTPLAGSTRSLDAGGMNPPFFLVSPAQVGFDPFGRHLLVTVKGTNQIRVYDVDEQGLPSAQPVTTMSHGNTPFGFAFDPESHLIVAEAFGAGEVGEGNASAASSYRIRPDGTLATITGSLPDLQTATCWVVTSWGHRYAYATNNASDAVTGFQVAADGSLTLLDPGGVSGTTGHAPVDLRMTPDGRFLYNVNAISGTVSGFRVGPDGSLAPLGEVGGLPAGGAVGMAAR